MDLWKEWFFSEGDSYEDLRVAWEIGDSPPELHFDLLRQIGIAGRGVLKRARKVRIGSKPRPQLINRKFLDSCWGVGIPFGPVLVYKGCRCK